MNGLRAKIDAIAKVFTTALLAVVVFFLQAWYRKVDTQVDRIPILEVNQANMQQVQRMQYEETKRLRELFEEFVRQERQQARRGRR